jgi:hypothetical protein
MRNVQVLAAKITVAGGSYVKLSLALAGRLGAAVTLISDGLYYTKGAVELLSGDILGMMPVAANRLGAAVLNLDHIDGEEE